LGVALFGAAAPLSFGADTPVSVDWASDGVGSTAAADIPPSIKTAHAARMFMFASVESRTRTQIAMAPTTSA
jgi:hypothetical protein